MTAANVRNFETLPKLNMKMILLFICVITLLTTSGCLVSESGRHRYSEVVVGPPAVIVPVPVVVVHPPLVIVR